MNTPVRIIEFSENGFRFKLIQILNQKFKDSPLHLEPVGEIKFQASSTEDDWYGMSFVVDTDNPEYLFKMAELSKLITSKLRWRAQPNEVMELIGGDEHEIFDQEFISKKKEGQSIYCVWRGESLQRKLIANSLEEAESQIEDKNLTVKHKSLIKF